MLNVVNHVCVDALFLFEIVLITSTGLRINKGNVLSERVRTYVPLCARWIRRWLLQWEGKVRTSIERTFILSNN